MSLASVPFLISIIAGVRAILRSIWDAAKQRAHTIWVWFGIIVPWVLKWLVNLRGWRLTVVVGLALLFAAAVRVVVQFTLSTWQVADLIGWAFEQFDFVGWLIWDGPLQLKVAWGRFWDLLSIWVSLTVMKLGLSKLSWWRVVARGLVNPSGS